METQPTRQTVNGVIKQPGKGIRFNTVWSKHTRAHWAFFPSHSLSKCLWRLIGHTMQTLMQHLSKQIQHTHTPQRSLWRGSVCICPSAPLLAATAGQSLLASAGNSPEPYTRYLNIHTHTHRRTHKWHYRVLNHWRGIVRGATCTHSPVQRLQLLFLYQCTYKLQPSFYICKSQMNCDWECSSAVLFGLSRLVSSYNDPETELGSSVIVNASFVQLIEERLSGSEGLGYVDRLYQANCWRTVQGHNCIQICSHTNTKALLSPHTTKGQGVW